MWWGQQADPGGEPPPPSEEQNLQDQFQQQRDKIEELKEILKKNDETLINREKEVEKYATKLSKIKSRSKTFQHKAEAETSKSGNKEQEPEVQEEEISENASLILEERSMKKDEGNLVLLNKESGEMPKSETPDQEPEIHKTEEVLENALATPKKRSSKKAQGNLMLLRKQLEENRAKFELRGKIMNENRKGIEDMVEHLKTQLDEREVQIKELQKAVEIKQSPFTAKEDKNVLVTSDEPQDVQAQIAHKDKNIILLNKKIVDLEAKIVDLNENFREKDNIIAARTKAVTLMSEDFSRRNKENVDTLEDTREEMRKMQNAFVEKEASLNTIILELKKELTAKSSRLHQIEENNKELHSVQFDLSSRNAELQEKVVKTQELNAQLQKQVAEQEERLQDSTEAEKMKSLLEDAQKQNAKMKAQHKSKIKNLNKQLDSLKKVSDANEEILKLQNKIAELEDEKGNLQLHLVDFDELKVSEAHWQTRVNELEEIISQHNQDLDSHVHMISILESEKIDHLKAIQEEKTHVADLEEQVEKLKTYVSDLENQKLSLELKAVDLEEQVDALNKAKKELLDEMRTLSDSNNTIEKRVVQEHLGIQVSVEGLEVLEQEQKSTYTEEEFNIDTVKKFEAELEKLRSVIEEQKEIIIELNSKVEMRDEELELQRQLIIKYEHLNTEEKEDKIMDIVKDLNDMASDLEEWKGRCNVVEKRLQDLEMEKDALEKCFKEVQTQNGILKQQLEDQKAITKDLGFRVQEQSNTILSRDDNIKSLQSMIELNGQTLEAREMTLKDVHEKMNNVEKQFENRLSELKQIISNKDRELQNLTEGFSKEKEVLKAKDNQLLELTDLIDKQKHEFLSLKQHAESSANKFQEEFAKLTAAVTAKDQLNMRLEEECQSCKQQIKELSTELSNKSRDDEMRTLETKLELAQSKLKESLDNLKELEIKMAELTEKNKKYVAHLKAKTVAVKGQEQKIEQYETLIQAKENEITDLTSRNEKLIKQFNDKNRSASQEVQDLMEKMGLLINELNEERTRSELISDELANATEKIVVLETEMKDSETKMQDMASLKDELVATVDRVTCLENEISRILSELRNKDEELILIKNERSQLNDHKLEQDTRLKEEVRKQTIQDEKIKYLEVQLTSQSDELERLRAEKTSMLEQVSHSYYAISNMTVDNVFQFKEAMEHFTEILQKHKQAVSASEAKVQEREAVIEFLEQEISRSTERIQHLEESLAFVEERRLSLENKAETLNLRLQESDRVKEEVVETEGMLEQRLQMLITSEESLKKKVNLLSAENEDLSQKVTELITQNGEARKELINAECILKDLQKETERLSPYEFSYGEAKEKIEHLESELKRVISERDHRMTERVQNLQQQTENLESDLRNMHMELEKVELEKRALSEKCEKLTDEKLNLEDEIESLNEVAISYKSENERLKENMVSAEAKQELEERIKALETELQDKTFIQEEKEIVINDLKDKIKLIENDKAAGELTIQALSTSKEELNERIIHLENDLENKLKSFEVNSMEKDRALANLQDEIMFLKQALDSRTLDVNNMNIEGEISQMNAELDSLRALVAQKDNEIKSYQTRMLQLQFDTAPHSLEVPDQFSQLQESNSKLQEMLKEKEAEVADVVMAKVASDVENEQLRDKITNDDYKSQLQESNSNLQKLLKEKESEITDVVMAQVASDVEIEQLKAKIAEDDQKFQALQSELEKLQEEIRNKDNYIQQITSGLQDEMLSLRSNYEEQLSNLQQQKTEVYEELLRIKASQEVSEIVHAAEDHVHRISSSRQADVNKKSVTFQDSVLETTVPIVQTDIDSGLENMFKELGRELQDIRTEKDEALLHLSEVSVQLLHKLQNMPQTEMGSIDLVEEENAEQVHTAENVRSEAVHEVESNENAKESSALKDTAITFEEEDWGWGSNEARLEEEHIQKQQHILLFSESVDGLNKRVTDLETEIKDLNIEREKLSKELHTSQVRSGKMLKKLKELKLQNDNLMKENVELTKKKTEKDFGDLDLAIEEELKIQIDTLEKEVKELKNERESAHIEKVNLLKQVDVLTSANERLVEVKERQDIDLEVWKQKNKDISNQLQALEWRLSEVESSTHDHLQEANSFFSWDKQGLTSHSEDVRELDLFAAKPQEQPIPESGEYEKVQALLEEERSLRTNAEMHVQQLQQRLLDVNSEIELLAKECADLKIQVEELKGQAVTVNDDHSNHLSAYSKLQDEYQNLQKSFEENSHASEAKYKEMLDVYVNKIEHIGNENKKLEEQCFNIQKELEEMNDLKKQNIALQSDFNSMKKHAIMQENSLEEQILRLEQEVIQLKSLADSESSSNVADILSLQLTKISELERELQSKIEEVEMLREVDENQKLELAQIEQEWNSKTERLRKELEYHVENMQKQRDLNDILKKEHDELQDHMNKVIEKRVQETFDMKQQEIDVLQVRLAEMQNVPELKDTEDLKQKLNESLQILEIRENYIKDLIISLSAKNSEYEEAQSLKDSDIQNLRIQLADTERKMVDLLGQKDEDIYNLRIQLAERDIKITELKQLLTEEGEELMELRKIAEEYETQQKRPTDKTEITSILPSDQQEHVPTSVLENKLYDETDDGSSERQKELDVALYMLHQRDVRCDELTLELMQLLEERDTLQLRLSNALRMNEELRSMTRTSTSSSPLKIGAVEKSYLSSSSRDESPQHITTSSTIETSLEMEEDLQALANKLSELRAVGYRDATLQDEQEQRHNEQVRLLHQRGSGIVVDADYTLSRDVQSPSTVLLNWIRGRSTPRVIHV